MGLKAKPHAVADDRAAPSQDAPQDAPQDRRDRPGGGVAPCSPVEPRSQGVLVAAGAPNLAYVLREPSRRFPGIGPRMAQTARGSCFGSRLRECPFAASEPRPHHIPTDILRTYVQYCTWSEMPFPLWSASSMRQLILAAPAASSSSTKRKQEHPDAAQVCKYSADSLDSTVYGRSGRSGRSGRGVCRPAAGFPPQRPPPYCNVQRPPAPTNLPC